MSNFFKQSKLLTETDISNSLPNQIDPLLKNSYSETTNNIRVTVWPDFIDSKLDIIGDIFIWAYHVRIDNNSGKAVKLINRHWSIIDKNGIEQIINGEGVIGQQPKILPRESFQYSSSVHLDCASGIMKGKYQMQYDNDKNFEVIIPSFSLDVPRLDLVVN